MFSYWFATYTWDFLNYLVPALGILVLFAAFQVDSYKDELGIVFLMLVSQHVMQHCFVCYLGCLVGRNLKSFAYLNLYNETISRFAFECFAL